MIIGHNLLAVFEYIRPSKRATSIQLCIGVFFSIGASLSPWIAVAIGEWRWYLLLISWPLLAVPFYPCVVVESAMWLMTRHRYAEAVECYQRVAYVNGRTLRPESIADCVRRHSRLGREEDRLYDVFRLKRLRRIMILLMLKS